MRAQFGGAVDMQLVKQLGLVDSVLNQLIDRGLFYEETQRLGLAVPDELIRARSMGTRLSAGRTAVRSPPVRAGADGEPNQRGSARRADAPGNPAQRPAAGDCRRVELPRPLVEALYRYRNEKRVAESSPSRCPQLPCRAAERGRVGAVLRGASRPFRAPEYRGFTLASLSPNDLKPEGEIPEDTLRREYEERKDEFQQPSSAKSSRSWRRPRRRGRKPKRRSPPARIFGMSPPRSGWYRARSNSGCEPEGNSARTWRCRVRAAAE